MFGSHRLSFSSEHAGFSSLNGVFWEKQLIERFLIIKQVFQEAYVRCPFCICDRLWENDPYDARSIVVIQPCTRTNCHFIDFRFFTYSSSFVYSLKSVQVWGSYYIPFWSYGPEYQARYRAHAIVTRNYKEAWHGNYTELRKRKSPIAYLHFIPSITACRKVGCAPAAPFTALKTRARWRTWLHTHEYLRVM